jgi:hypothetical protein
MNDYTGKILYAYRRREVVGIGLASRLFGEAIASDNQTHWIKTVDYLSGKSDFIFLLQDLDNIWCEGERISGDVGYEGVWYTRAKGEMTRPHACFFCSETLRYGAESVLLQFCANDKWAICCLACEESAISVWENHIAAMMKEGIEPRLWDVPEPPSSSPEQHVETFECELETAQC